MSNLGAGEYRVKGGDTLWDIARRECRDPTAWREIARINNLPDGNFILVGMVLKIPPMCSRHEGLAHHPNGPAPGSELPTGVTQTVRLGPTKSPLAPHGPAPAEKHKAPDPPPRMPRALHVLPPAGKYSFDVLPPILLSSPAMDVKIKLTGEIAVEIEEPLTEIEVSSSGELSGSIKSEYDSRFSKAGGEIKATWNPESKELEMSCGFTIAGKVNGKEFVTQEFHFIPPNKYTYKISPKAIEGEIRGTKFKGSMGFEVEVTVKKPEDRPPQTQPTTQPTTQPATEPSRRRDISTGVYVVAGALVLTGVVIIVADAVKDVGTVGVGTVESPVSWAAAMGLFARAAVMVH